MINQYKHFAKVKLKIKAENKQGKFPLFRFQLRIKNSAI